jgi:S-adenosylmethionine hydrolase
VAAIVTLTTDFGVRDSYVGTMKGVILSRCPEAQIVDICHEVLPQQVRIGALRLAAAAPYFPPGTVHVAVVDPGVGSTRRAIAIEAGTQRFVGPDNGVLTLAARQIGPEWHAFEITNPARMLPWVSQTFHGRDVFAPAAAYLAAGGSIDDLGPALVEVVELQLPRPAGAGSTLNGLVLDVDRFGNLITNVRAEDLAPATDYEVRVGAATIVGLSRWYDPERELVAIIDSDGWLEIAAPGMNAAEQLGVGLDAQVEVRPRSAPSVV